LGVRLLPHEIDAVSPQKLLGRRSVVLLEHAVSPTISWVHSCC